MILPDTEILRHTVTIDLISMEMNLMIFMEYEMAQRVR